jgi:hypothetical protein
MAARQGRRLPGCSCSAVGSYGSYGRYGRLFNFFSIFVYVFFGFAFFGYIVEKPAISAITAIYLWTMAGPICHNAAIICHKKSRRLSESCQIWPAGWLPEKPLVARRWPAAGRLARRLLKAHSGDAKAGLYRPAGSPYPYSSATTITSSMPGWRAQE